MNADKSTEPIIIPLKSIRTLSSIYVNDAEIEEAEIGREMQYHPAPTQERAWRLAAQSLVIRQLLLQQAVSNGLCEHVDSSTPIDKEEEIIDQLLLQDVSVPEADEATCRRFYDRHPDSFKDDKSGERVPFNRAQDNIRDYLHIKAMRAAVAEYIKALSYSAEIKGFELDNL
jgi:peptidyl-prolyl cis-trans isomerase C